jgi:acetolactate synthase-1/2/3 large subunit
VKGAEILLKMLEAYGVEHVFGLPGETTLPWYKEWHKHPQIEHVLTRDERKRQLYGRGLRQGGV